MAKHEPPKKGGKPQTTLDLQAEDVTNKKQSGEDHSPPSILELDKDARSIIEGSEGSAKKAGVSKKNDAYKAFSQGEAPNSEAKASAQKGEHKNGSKSADHASAPKKTGAVDKNTSATAETASHDETEKASNAATLSAFRHNTAADSQNGVNAQAGHNANETEAADRNEAGGFGTVFLMTTSALIGGFAALALQFALETANVLPFGVARQTEDLQQSLSVLRSDFVRFRDQTEAASSNGGGDAAGSSIDNAALDSFQQRLQILENELQGNEASEELATFDELQSLQERLQSVEQSQSALRILLQEGGSGAQRAVDEQALNAAIDDRLQSVQERLDGFARDNEVAALAQEVERLQTLLTDMNARSADRSSDGRQMSALALTVAGLEKALRDGSPYQTYLTSLQRSAPESASPPELVQAYADEGVPTLSELDNGAQNAMRALLQNRNAEGPSFFERLANSASSVIIVRPSASRSPDGSDVKSVMARLENALAEGDMARAVNEWQSLDAQTRQQADNFGRDLQARYQMEQWLSALSEKILDDLSGNG
jgi:hypothetical protein